MTDMVMSIFEFQNARGHAVPHFQFQYKEADTGNEWKIDCGGTRGYFGQFVSKLDDNLEAHAADSHFGVQRVLTALFISGFGLFESKAVGRIFIKDLKGNFTYYSQVNTREPYEKIKKLEATHSLFDWLPAICAHNVLRRALDDAYLALQHPHEAFVFVYRGFEWIRTSFNLSWEDVASDVGVSVADIKELGKLANYETGIRHASKSGKKLRADPVNYGTWVCGLVDAVNAARKRLEPKFERMDAKAVAAVIKAACPPTAFE